MSDIRDFDTHSLKTFIYLCEKSGQNYAKDRLFVNLLLLRLRITPIEHKKKPPLMNYEYHMSPVKETRDILHQNRLEYELKSPNS